jgi:hypothetical protein
MVFNNIALFQGLSNDEEFTPFQEATRAQAAVMLKRLLQTVQFID